jgi:hypothetical protein
VAEQLDALLAAESALLAQLSGQPRKPRRKPRSAAMLLTAFRERPTALYSTLAQRRAANKTVVLGRAAPKNLRQPPQATGRLPDSSGALSERQAAAIESAVSDLVKQYRALKQQLRQARQQRPGQARTHQALLADLETEHQRLMDTIKNLSAADLAAPGVVGEWSAKDLLAHLTTWARMFMGWYAAGLRGETPAVPAEGHTWRNLHALNDSIYRQHRRRAARAIVAEFEATHAQLLKVAQSIPEADLHVKGKYAWMGGYSLWAYVRANGGGHYRWAANAIRKWAKARQPA